MHHAQMEANMFEASMAQNEITDPVAPRPVPKPGFRDGRPADQIIADPTPGYDYGGHPEAAKIHQGLAQKRLNSGQPTAGMKIGMPAAAPQPPANVGVTNPYTQPAPQMSPHGQQPIGEFSMGGKTDQIYSDPDAAGRRQAIEQHTAATHEHGIREQQIADTHNLMMNLATGGMPQIASDNIPRRTPGEDSDLMNSLAAHMSSLMGNDAAIHTAASQKVNHFNPLQNPAYMAAQIDNMKSEADYHRAQAANADPMKKLDLLSALSHGDPSIRSMAMLMSGVDPSAVSSLPQTPTPGSVNQGNLAQHLGSPQNSSLSAVLANPDMTFGQQLDQASLFPGFGDQAHPTRQIVDQWMRQKFAGKPDDWKEQLYSPPNPANQIPILGRVEGLLRAAANPIGRAFGVGAQGGTGTGLGWNKNYADSQRRIGIIKQFGLDPNALGE